MEGHIRVHADKVPQERLHEWLKETVDRYYLAYEEQASRPHYQAYVKCKYKKDTIRRKLRAEFSVEGNKDFSVSELKKEVKDLVCYLMKEGKCVGHNLPDEVIEEAQAQSREIQNNKKPRRGTTIVAQLMDYIEGLVPDPDSLSRFQISCYIMKWFKDSKRLLPDPIMLTRYTNTIHAQYNGTQAYVDIIMEMFRFHEHQVNQEEAHEIIFSG